MGSEEMTMPPFGLELREKEFCMRKGSMFLNHGSFGMVPRRIKDVQKSYIDKMDDHPDDWFRRNNLGKWKAGRDAIAMFVNANPEDVVLVQNATTGINTILKSLNLKEGDGILATDNTYPAIQFTCEHVKTSINGAKYHMMGVKYPIENEDDVVDQYRQFLSSNPNVRLAVIDHITSSTAVVMPIKKIIQVCREHNVMSMIDGAHAPGQVPIDMKDLDPDFYTGNLHKWAYTPRGCALLYVRKEHHAWVRPLVTSWYYLKEFTMEFFMQGTRDDCAYVTVPDALQFYDDLGGMTAITGHNSSLLDILTERMVTEWGTDKLPIPRDMEAPCLRMVRLPKMDGYDITTAEAYRLMDDLFYEHDIQVQLFCVLDSLFVRLSANVYNYADEYSVFINLIRDVSQNKRPMCLERISAKSSENSDMPFSAK
ncbi:probable L-cysteine desulfhydrase, chloroplastic [Mizuhopecten yessoensis]|uniref:probable L-cysteine desulfhydrase, chloroplastic n=1 Tax=Mizuhopecten yessoensis TaxID=6573 RepID=UPI000B458578|nr:probable L-cysteine desulfhydrase, chloroplastic [Mizuhopecten yessoensis]